MMAVRSFRDHSFGRVQSDCPTTRANQRRHRDDVFAGSAPNVERCVAACQLELIEAPLLALTNDVAPARRIQVLDEARCRVSCRINIVEPWADSSAGHCVQNVAGRPLEVNMSLSPGIAFDRIARDKPCLSTPPRPFKKGSGLAPRRRRRQIEQLR